MLDFRYTMRARTVVTPALNIPLTGAGELQIPAVDPRGAMFVRPVGASGLPINVDAPQDGYLPSFAEASNSINYAFNGSSYDRLRSVSVSNVNSSLAPKGTIHNNEPAQWILSNLSVRGGQAIVSKPGVVNQIHIAKTIVGHCTNNLAVNTQLGLQLLDGAAVIGFWILHTNAVVDSADRIVISGLNISASVGAALTLQFSAGFSQYLQSVTLTGITVGV